MHAYMQTGPAPESDRIEYAKRRFEAALEELNICALELNGLKVEPLLESWTTPMDRGKVRLQGNATASYQRHGS